MMTENKDLARLANCDCSLRSFWEGDCDYCTAHPLPRHVVENYEEYGNSYEFSISSPFDESVQNAASELGKIAGRSISDLYAGAM